MKNGRPNFVRFLGGSGSGRQRGACPPQWQPAKRGVDIAVHFRFPPPPPSSEDSQVADPLEGQAGGDVKISQVPTWKLGSATKAGTDGG